MKRLWGILGSVGAIVALAAAPALAATYWVSPTGVAGQSGADTTAGAATTLTWFNANAQPGDICRFKSGDYGTERVDPAASGTAANRIRYYGFPEDPLAVRVSEIRFGGTNSVARRGDYCTARWIKTTSDLRGMPYYLQGGANYSYANYDSLVKCSGPSSEFVWQGDGCLMDSLTLTGSQPATGDFHYLNIYSSYTSVRPKNNEFKNSTINLTLNGAGQVHVVGFNRAQYNTMYGNTFNITVTSCGGYFFLIEHYRSYYNLFQNNVFNVAMNATPLGTVGGISHRDTSSYNRYIGNSFISTGTGRLQYLWTNSGSWGNTTVSNSMIGNTFKAAVSGGRLEAGPLMYYYDGARKDTVALNIFAVETSGGYPVLQVKNQLEDMLFSHNVFFTNGKTAFDTKTLAYTPTGQNRLSNNVFYSTVGVPDASNALVKYSQGMEADSSGLYFAPAGAATYAVDNGTGATAPSGTRNVWGTPTFVDSAYATLDPRVTSVYATGSEWGDGFVGTGQNLGVPPTVSIAHPITANTDTVWNTYETMGVWWTATDNVSVSSITLEWMHPDEGLNEWSTIATGEANDGYYAWTLPAFKFSTVAVRVTAIDGDGLTTSATATFRCYAPEIPDRRPTVDDP